MPQPRSKRNAEPEPEPEEAEVSEDEELDDAPDDEGGQQGPAGINIDVAEDRVVIDLPRDGNERSALEAIGAMLDAMS